MSRVRVAFILALAVVGLGASSALSGARTTAAPPTCPTPRAQPDNQDVRPVIATVQAKLGRIFGHSSSYKGSVYAAFPLASDQFVPGVRYAYYKRLPHGKCGESVIERSWVALAVLPRAPMASLYPAVIYVVHTDAGWRPWYEAFPNARTGGLIDPH